MPTLPRASLALGSAAALILLAACASDSPTGPLASRGGVPGKPSSPSPTPLPTGEHQVGHAAIEPAYNDQTGELMYLLTPEKAPLPSHANHNAVSPLYLIEYPPGSSPGTLNCMGVPGNCPDHDGLMASLAMQFEPTVYGSDPTAIPGHDHLADPPGGSEFNVAWEVYLITFTSTAAAQTHITTEAQLDAALASGAATKHDLGFAFNCSVVSSAVYAHGTPIGS
jgi:hypothetical protein